MPLELLIPFIIGAYLVGSVPCGIIVARVLGGSDPRSSGSGNIGATNVHRTLGRSAGAATLVGDMAKGALPTLVALFYFSEPLAVGTVGFVAFLGHLFPVFLGFKGGKGVATAAGVLLVVSPPVLFFSVLVFAFFLSIFRFVSLGSIMAAVSMPLFLFLLNAHLYYVYMGLAITIFVIIKHLGNIKRLIERTENKFG